MFVGFIVAIASIALVPALLFFDGAIARACVIALAAVALGMAARETRQEDIDHLRHILPRVMIGALLLALWMFIQVLPLGIFGVGHPIWSSTSAALGSPLIASISVDPGATLIALGRYLGFIALALAVALATVDRRHAEQMLFVLVTITALIAALALFRPDMIARSQSTLGAFALNTVPTIVGIGCVLALATGVRAYERSETRKQGKYWSPIIGALPGTIISGIAFLLCLFVLFRIGKSYITAATAIGLGIFAALSLIRRLGFGTWGMAAIGVALAAIAFAVFSQTDVIRSANPLLAFVSNGSGQGTDLAARMLADLRWGGTGAGTLPELTQLYRDVNEGPDSVNSAFSSAAVIAIELGRPALVLICIGIIALAVTLLQATINRGRDSFFPAAGSASIVILAIAAFGDTALLTPALATLMSVIVGLSIAQSVGRSGNR